MGSYSESRAPSATRVLDWVLGRRRRFLVPGRYQRRALVFVGGLSAVLLAAVNVSLYLLVRSGSAEVLRQAPELSAILLGQDRDLMLLIVLASLVTFVGILLVTLLETHRTAGPLFALQRTMAQLASGIPAELRLREDDGLRELQVNWTRLVACMTTRARTRARTLADAVEALEREAQALTRPGEHDAARQERLRSIAHELRTVQQDLEQRL